MSPRRRFPYGPLSLFVTFLTLIVATGVVIAYKKTPSDRYNADSTALNSYGRFSKRQAEFNLFDEQYSAGPVTIPSCTIEERHTVTIAMTTIYVNDSVTLATPSSMIPTSAAVVSTTYVASTTPARMSTTRYAVTSATFAEQPLSTSNATSSANGTLSSDGALSANGAFSSNATPFSRTLAPLTSTTSSFSTTSRPATVPSSSTISSTSTVPTTTFVPPPPPPPPPSLEYMEANVTNNKGGKVLPEEAYDYVKHSIEDLDESLILPEGQTGDCNPLPDDPCIDVQKALQDPKIQEILKCKSKECKGTDDNNDNNDNNNHNEDEDDDDDDNDLFATVYGTIGGTIGGGVAASAFGAYGWYRGHQNGWKFGEFMYHRSWSLWDFFRSKLPPADITRYGFAPPSPPAIIAPPLPPPPPAPPVLPPVPPAINPFPQPPSSPKDMQGPDENGPEEEQEDPDDGTSQKLRQRAAPMSPRRDPPVIRLLTRAKNPDCPPKLQKAEAELKAKDQEIQKLKQDLQDAQKKKQKAEDDFDDCSDELQKLHEAQEQLKKIGSRNAAKKLREANLELKEKEKLVDQLLARASEAGGEEASLKQQLAKARSDLEKAQDSQEKSLELANTAVRDAKAAQEQVAVWVDTAACYQNTLEETQAVSDTCEKQLNALRSVLHQTETALDDANARAATAEGTREASEQLIKQLQQDNAQMSKHTCPASVLTQPKTCRHTNEEIAQMKLTLEACKFDRKTLRKPDPIPAMNEEDLPLIDQLERCKHRWHQTLAQKASLSSELERTNKATSAEILRLKSDLAICQRELNGEGGPSRSKPAPEDTSVGGRVRELERKIKECAAQKEELKKGKCPPQMDGACEMPPTPPGSPAAQLQECTRTLDETNADAKQCWDQCECPDGLRMGPDHLRRTLVAREWFDTMVVNGTLT